MKMWPNDNNACRRSDERGTASSQAENLLGDIPALLEQMGVHGISPSAQPPLAPAGSLADISGIQAFLDSYLAEILLPLELPYIVHGFERTVRGHARELIALDQQLSLAERFLPFAAASRQVGATQLRRLKPLRDQRTVRRYLFAVETGKAAGWHTLVYGLTLAVYSFPLRQGLLHYGRETISGLARSAAHPEVFLQADCQEMLDSILARLPAAVEQAIPAGEASTLRLTKPE